MDSHIWSHSSQQEHPLQKPDRPKKYFLEDRTCIWVGIQGFDVYLYTQNRRQGEYIIGGEN